jgi:hypothetical protein
MSKYKLSYEQVKELGLEPTTWDEIEKANIKRVYIQAHIDSAIYGPYFVSDASKCTICKLDGTDIRAYPRDKGLFREPPMAWGYVSYGIGGTTPTRTNNLSVEDDFELGLLIKYKKRDIQEITEQLRKIETELKLLEKIRG